MIEKTSVASRSCWISLFKEKGLKKLPKPTSRAPKDDPRAPKDLPRSSPDRPRSALKHLEHRERAAKREKKG